LKRLFLLALMVFLGGVANAGGAEIFSANCVICHQANAQGIPGMYPPLADSIGSYVAVPAGRAYLVHVVSFGMTGTVSVHGQTYNGMMQPWPKLKDEDLAQVLNYVLTTFNTKLLPRDFPPLTSAEVKKYRNLNTGLGDVRKEREALMKTLAAHRGSGT
jgi:mono/diheme cytochrome c family protein